MASDLRKLVKDLVGVMNERRIVVVILMMVVMAYWLLLWVIVIGLVGLVWGNVG